MPSLLCISKFYRSLFLNSGLVIYNIEGVIMKIKNPAFVFNCHYNGLAILQDLGRRGVPVYALDSHRSVGTISRYARFLKVPNPITDEDEFV